MSTLAIILFSVFSMSGTNFPLYSGFLLSMSSLNMSKLSSVFLNRWIIVIYSHIITSCPFLLILLIICHLWIRFDLFSFSLWIEFFCFLCVSGNFLLVDIVSFTMLDVRYFYTSIIFLSSGTSLSYLDLSYLD